MTAKKVPTKEQIAKALLAASSVRGEPNPEALRVQARFAKARKRRAREKDAEKLLRAFPKKPGKA